MYMRGDETSISTCAFTQKNAVSIEGKLTWEYVGFQEMCWQLWPLKEIEDFWGNDLPHYVLNWPIIVFNFKCLYKQVLYKYPQRDHIELVTQLTWTTNSLSNQKYYLSISVLLSCHVITGSGRPLASHTITIVEPSATSVSLGANIILGGTEIWTVIL